MSILHSDVEISTLCNIDRYMTLYEQNCNFCNLKMAALGRIMYLIYFANKYNHLEYNYSCVF